MENKEISPNAEKEAIVQCSEAHDEGGIPVSDEEDNFGNSESDQMEQNQNEVPSEELQNEALSVPINAVDEMSIAGEISKYIHANRINLGELENSLDMWAICDAISAAHSGLPDSLLREAFLLVLEGFYSFAQNNPWMRKHLDQLSRVWKREMLNEKSTNRPTKFVSSSAEIAAQKETSDEGVRPTEHHHSPIFSITEEDGNDQHQEMHGQGDTGDLSSAADAPSLKSRRQRRQAAKRKRALAVMMGVGQMLKQARRTLNTETGQLDVDEDEFGNFSIGGTELTFESWGKINATNLSDVVYISEQQQLQKPETVVKQKEQQQRGDNDNNRSARKQQQNGGIYPEEENAVENRTDTLRQPDSSATSTTKHLNVNSNESNKGTEAPLMEGMAKRYPTVAEVEMPTPVDEDQRLRPSAAVLKGQSKKGRKAAKIERKQKRLEEKDEGELSSSDSEEPTSSEEEEGDMASSADEAATRQQANPRQIASRERRRMRRVDEQKQGASSAQNLQALLRKCFELRSRIVGKLSIGQKAMFRDCLNKSISGTLQQQPQQHQLQQIIHSVAKPVGSAKTLLP